METAIYLCKIFPVRLWIRRHYTKMRGKFYAKCNHCPKEVCYRPLYSLHNHLVEEHSNVLTEEEKKDKRTHWTWDLFTIKDIRNVICNICGTKMMYDQKNYKHVSQHLRKMHGILPPCIDDMDNVGSDANTNTTIRKDQIHSATSSKICKNMEHIGLDKNVADHTLDLPLRRDMDLDLSIYEDVDIVECLSSPSQSSPASFFDIEICEEIFNFFTQE